MSRFQVCVLAPLLALCACTSTTGTTPDTTSGMDSAVGGPADGAGSSVPADATEEGADATVDAGQSPHDAAATTNDAARGMGPAGKSGVDAFCTELCSHEQTCALIDAGAPSLSACVATFQAFYEASGANPWGSNPPLELYRADYVSALGSCMASASCSEPLNTSEGRCSAALVVGTDAGAASIKPTTALTTLCRAFQGSACLAADSGAQDCTGTMMLFNDQALTTAAACFAGSSACSTVNSCFAAAFTQP